MRLSYTMVRKKISRWWQDTIGNGKEALGERSEEDISLQEAAEIFQRVPPFITLNAFPRKPEGGKDFAQAFNDGRVGPIQATGDEVSEYLNAASESGTLLDMDFTVPHREKRRGTTKSAIHNSWGSQYRTTGDTIFNIEADFNLPKELETAYGDTVPEGSYVISASSKQMNDQQTDAVLGNIESRTEVVKASQSELIDYLEGLEGEINAEDFNADKMAKKAFRMDNWSVENNRFLKDGNGSEAAEFVEAMYETGYPEIWSGLIYEGDDGETKIWHLAAPGSKDKLEGHRPYIRGTLNTDYDETVEYFRKL